MVSAPTTFLGWWRDELSTFIPASTRKLFENHFNELNIRICGERLQLSYKDKSGVRQLGAVPLNSESLAEGRRQVQHALAALPNAPQIMLEVALSQTLCRSLTFPTAAEENLHQVASYEIARRTPFDTDEVYFDIDIVERIPEQGSIIVVLYVVPRQTIDDAVATMTALGLRPDRVGISATSGESAPNVNFLSARDTERRDRVEKFAVAAVGIVAVALLITSIILPLERKRTLSIQLTEQASTLSKQAAVVAKLDQEIQEARERNRFIANERTELPPAVAIINDLTRVLPDDTWLFQMHIKDGHVSLQGYTNAVSALVELIESSPRFRNVAVQSNITRDQKTGQERFHIAFDLADKETPHAAQR